MVFTTEERKEYNKAYYEKNKEKIDQRIKKRYENNKDKIKEQQKEYLQTDTGKKLRRINKWEKRGVKSEDYSSLYEYYLNCKYCENCDVELVEGNVGANKKVLDHSHKTGLFRNVLCHSCNNKRKEDNF